MVKYDLNNNRRTWLEVLTVCIIVILLSIFWASAHLRGPPPLPPQFSSRSVPPHMPPPGDIELYYTAKTVLSTLNITLLVFLLGTYVLMYVRSRSEFTLWLGIISGALLLNSLTSNPPVQSIFGYQPFGLGPFAMLPDIFTLIVLAILLYLTLKY